MTDFVENELPRAETLPQPESGPEIGREHAREHEVSRAPEKINEALPVAPIVLPAREPQTTTDPVVASLEKILSEDLLEHFRAMPPEAKAKFKAKGEETVSRLTVMMSRTAIKAKEVLQLIVGWLRFIPGVSKYFLEQESKIKTDKILELYKRNHGNE